jgi:hypothetical protein
LGFLFHLAGHRGGRWICRIKETIMKFAQYLFVIFLTVAALAAPKGAGDQKIDLSKERTSQPPTVFEPMVGTWIVTEDNKEEVVMVDGRPWVASKDNPTKLLIDGGQTLSHKK